MESQHSAHHASVTNLLKALESLANLQAISRDELLRTQSPHILTRVGEMPGQVLWQKHAKTLESTKEIKADESETLLMSRPAPHSAVNWGSRKRQALKLLGLTQRNQAADDEMAAVKKKDLELRPMR